MRVCACGADDNGTRRISRVSRGRGGGGHAKARANLISLLVRAG